MVDIEQITSEVRRNGYFHSGPFNEKDFLGLAVSLGDLRADRYDTDLVREIRPEPRNGSKPNTLSGRYGTGAFPFHTDAAHWIAPARFLLLYCIDPGRARRKTLLIDSASWVLSVAERRLLCAEVWAAAHLHPFLCTVAKQTENRLQFRFDEACMSPLTTNASKARDIVRSQIKASDVIAIEWEAGHLLVIDNGRMLHARGEAPISDRDRTHKRVLVGG